jgi:hypothetical protein
MDKIDFIIGGAQKCGTSALMRYLAQHPDVYIPAREMHYFDKLIKKHSIDWYLKQFSQGEGKVVGEKTPAYIRFPGIPQTIKKYFPDIKIVFVLRDPVKRAYSHYWHLRRQSLEFRSFEDAIEKPYFFGIGKSPGYIERGIYVKQLTHWFRIFDNSQILIVKAEDLRNRTKETLNKVFDHIGVRKDIEIVTPPVHVGTSPRNLLHYAVLFPVNALKQINNYRIESLHEFLLKAYRFLLKFGKLGYPEMDEQTELRLQSIFAPYNKLLKDLTGVGWDY